MKNPLPGLAAVVALILSGAAIAQPAVVEELPFELNSNKIYLNVGVNGRDEPFVLDTGAPETHIDLDLARALSLPLRDAGRGGGAGESTYERASTDNVTLQLGGLTVGPRSVAVLPIDRIIRRYEGRHLRGMIGADIISRYVVEIDYAASVLRLHEASRFTYNGPGRAIPIAIDGLIYVEASVAVPGRAPIEGHFVLDTGARLGVALSTHLVNRHRLLEDDVKSYRTVVGAGAGGELHHHVTRLESLTMKGVRGEAGGDVVMRGVVATLSQDKAGAFASDGVDGLIGAEVLKRYLVFVDYGRKRVILEPRTDRAVPAEMNLDCSGLFLVADGEDLKTLTVLSVAADSPAAEARIMKGDVVREIGGEQGSTLENARRILKEPGRLVPLTIRRGDETIRVHLKTRPLI